MTPAPRSRFRDAGVLAWLVVLLPLAAIAAGVTTVVISIGAGSTDAVIDPVKRTAQIQERDMEADRRTLAYGLRATLRRGDGVSVRIEGALPPSDTLTLTLAHPLASSQDRTIELSRHGDREFIATTDIGAGHDWNVLLAPPDAGWRLVGRLVQDQAGTDLRPALDRQPAG